MELPDLPDFPSIPEGAISFSVVNNCNYVLSLGQYWSNRELYHAPQDTLNPGENTTVTFSGPLWMIATLTVDSLQKSPFPVMTIGVCSGFKNFKRIDYFRCESTTMGLPSDYSG